MPLAIEHQKITLDVNENCSSKILKAHQGDKGTRFIDVTLIASGQSITLTSSYTAVVSASVNGVTKAINDCTINTTNQIIVVELTDIMLDTSGELLCDLSLIEDNKRITSATFTVLVQSSAVADETQITSSEEYGALTSALTSIADVADKAALVQEMVDNISDLSAANDLVTKKVDYYNAGAGDLNSFKLQNTHSDVAVYTLKGGYTHAPSDVIGIYGYMIVGKQTSGTNIWIEQSLYVNDKIYHRRYTEYNSSGSWSEWVRLATSADISNLQQQINNIQPGSQLPNADEMGF